MTCIGLYLFCPYDITLIRTTKLMMNMKSGKMVQRTILSSATSTFKVLKNEGMELILVEVLL